MERKEVESKLIRSIGYDTEKQMMEVEFTTTMIYEYRHFPEAVYNKILEARSIDNYFRDNIVNRYPYVRMK